MDHKPSSYKPRSQRPALDVHSIYARIVDSLHLTTSKADKEAEDMVKDARSIVDSLAGTEDGTKAKKELDVLYQNIKTLKGKHAEGIRKTSKESAAILEELHDKFKKEIALAKGRDNKQRIRDAYNAKMQQAQLDTLEKMQRLEDEYNQANLAIRRGTLDVLKGMKQDLIKIEQKRLKDQLEALNKQEEQYDDILDKLADNEKPKKKETKEQELRRQLHELSKGYFRRFVVDPIVGNIADTVSDVAKKVKDATGITRVTEFIQSEKERAVERKRTQVELDRLLHVTQVREELLKKQATYTEELAKLTGKLPANEEFGLGFDERDEKASVTEAAEGVASGTASTVSLPKVMGSDLVSVRAGSGLAVNPTTKPVTRTEATSIAAQVVDTKLKAQAKPSEYRPQLTTVASTVQKVRDDRASAANESYSSISEAADNERTMRALERIADGVNKKQDTGLGIGDLVMLAGAAATTLAALLDKLGLKGMVDTILGLPGKIANLSKEMAAKAVGWLKSVGEFVDKGWKNATAWFKEAVVDKVVKLYDWVKGWIGDKLDGAKAVAQKVTTAVKDAAGGVVDKAMDMAKGAKDAVVSKAGGALETAKGVASSVGSAVSSGVSSAGSAISSGAQAAWSKGVSIAESAGSLAKSTATAVGEGVSKTASAVGSAVSTGAAMAGKAVKSTASSIVNVAKTMANSPVGQFIGKNLNRLGNIGAAFQVISGVADEAAGRHVDDTSILDALLNPMDAGRFLGNKFNKTFESRMGQPLGSWLYDQFNPEDRKTLTELKVARSENPRDSTMVKKVTVPAPVSVDAPTGAPSSPKPAMGGVQPKAPSTTTAVNTNLNARTIPDLATNDVSVHALNLGLLN